MIRTALFAAALASAAAFRRPLRMGLAPAAPANVKVLEDATAVSAAVLGEVERCANAAIAKKGFFTLAIPGGSILKMLSGAQAPAWADKTMVAYVNHKCVAMDDAELATHAKASALFLDTWEGVDTVVMGGSDDAAAEALAYEEKLQSYGAQLPTNADGFPEFDLMLIGVGDDGHVGSLYPDRDEVLEKKRWVLDVDMKTPGSITLSMPVMRAAKRVVVAACGVSEKYPQGKSAGMRRAIEDNETPETFPAAALRDVCTYIIDEAAASKLSMWYQPRTTTIYTGESETPFNELIALVAAE
mmetsp:Transcript_43926/g.138042  ORF Transcript_43926/g.138042 Transcript_43926/m.138042 type:complete len:300 (+) Transcript_43926:195-1094(+)